MLDELRVFVATVEAGTLTAAAKTVHLTQPAVTASLQRLESSVGARLLERSRSGVRLTDAGRALLPHAQDALLAVRDGRRAVADVAALVAGEVRIGAGPTACGWLLPPRLASFRRQWPGVRVWLREVRNERVWEGLRAGKVDLAIVSARSVPDQVRPFTVDPWMEDELVLVAPAHGDTPLDAVSHPKGSIFRAILQTHFPEWPVVMELGSITAALEHVAEGVGVALVSARTAKPGLESGRLRVVQDPRLPIPRALVLVHRGEQRLSAAAARLRSHLLTERAVSEHVEAPPLHPETPQLGTS